MVFPRLGPKPSSRSYTATDTVSLRIWGLPTSSSSTNTSKTARLQPRLPSAATPSPAPGAAPANGAPLQLFIARSVQVGKSESGDSVAVDRDGVVRGSVVGRVDSELITRIASALRCTPGQPRPDGSEKWDAGSGASAMMSSNKGGMYNIRHPTDQYIQIGDPGSVSYTHLTLPTILLV